MLLVPISFFLCLVDYALEGSTFSLSKCDFSRLFHTESHGTHIDLLWLSFLAGRICPLMHEHFLWPLLKRKAFYCGWIGFFFFFYFAHTNNYNTLHLQFITGNVIVYKKEIKRKRKTKSTKILYIVYILTIKRRLPALWSSITHLPVCHLHFN